jgi:hypothetical protein
MALHWVAENGGDVVARLLLEGDGDADIVDRFGWTVQHLAAENWHGELIATATGKGD